MDSATSVLSKIPITSIIWIVVLVVVTGYVVSVIFNTPRYQVNEKEGFFGGVVRGSGHPDCLRTLDNAAQILAALAPKSTIYEQGPPDFRELQLLLSKMACLKKDLLSPSGIVEATRYQPYENAHDREPVAEVAATCLSHTISPRDLDIIFVTWRDRGNWLIRRLCTAANLSEQEAKRLDNLFAEAWRDVYDVAKGRCIPSQAETSVERQEQPYEPPELSSARAYDGYYSGWTGQI